MSKSALKMSKDSGVNYSTIRRWIKKGYFGEVKTDKNGRYVFPDNMPLPYKSNGKVERDTTLLMNFINASDLGRIVHKDMFPKTETTEPTATDQPEQKPAPDTTQCHPNYIADIREGVAVEYVSCEPSENLKELFPEEYGDDDSFEEEETEQA